MANRRLPGKISEIVAGELYLGNQSASRDCKLLCLLGITTVVSVGCQAKTPTWFEVERHHLPQSDSDGYILTTAAAAAELIDAANGAVLVHCQAGMSRSPAVVAAYLVTRRGYSPEEAWRTVVNARPKIRPRADFVVQVATLAEE